MHPVLLWPEGLSEKLDDAHLEAVIAHELCHVRRRQHLMATIHMLVEAAFWFHPLVWWLGARLIDERERACDEEVLQRGSERHLYAESILKICEFCLSSPRPACQALRAPIWKKRMVHIMTDHVIRKPQLPSKAPAMDSRMPPRSLCPSLLACSTPLRARRKGTLRFAPSSYRLQSSLTRMRAMAW